MTKKFCKKLVCVVELSLAFELNYNQNFILFFDSYAFGSHLSIA